MMGNNSKYGSTPRLQYGFGGTVNYKKFDFGVFFSGSALRSIMTNGIDPFQEGIAVGNRNVLKYIADNYWSEEKLNWDAKYPRLGLLATDVANNTVNSSYWLRNGSFLRLKNVEVGYKIPYGRIFVSAANLFTFSPFDLWDPELSSWNSYHLILAVQPRAISHRLTRMYRRKQKKKTSHLPPTHSPS